MNINISKYFTKKIYNFGDIISEFVIDLHKINNYKNILFIRTCTTGGWLDDLFIDNNNVTRILYYTDKVNQNTNSHKSTIIIHSDKLESTLISLNMY